MVVVINALKPMEVSASTKVSYRLKKVEKKIKNRQGQANTSVSYQLPVIKGKSKLIKTANKALKRECNAYFDKYYDLAAMYGKDRPSSTEKWFCRSTTKVRKNSKGIIKFEMKHEWYMGGVYQVSTTTQKYIVKSTVFDLKGYLKGGIGANTRSSLKELVQRITGMNYRRNSKYPDLYYKGNQMIIGFNMYAQYGTKKDIYLRISNTGNKKVKYFGVRIGDSRETMERKLKRYHYATYNNGKTYMNSDASYFKPVFRNGRLDEFHFYCRPTS